MKLGLLCDAAEIACGAEERAIEIASIESDSRYVTPNGMFVCIRGLHTDGHTYIADAIEAGAICVLIEEDETPPSRSNVIFLKAKNTRAALAYLYHAWYDFPTRKMKMIGVTGTNGKTSVTHMLQAIFDAALCRCGLIGTIGCRLGEKILDARSQNGLANMTTPDPRELYRVLAEMADGGAEYVLMEVTSHALAMGKLAPIEFAAAIFTNLTPEHLDFHGTMEAYAAAKATLLSKSRLCVINTDSPYAKYMQTSAKGRVVTCSARADADYIAQNSLHSDKGVSYTLSSGSLHQRITCSIPGDFTVMNSMQAAVCALELGFVSRIVKDALASIKGVMGRMENVRLGLGADFNVLIDYAHTPDALENLLLTAKKIGERNRRIVLLFGCGGDRDRGKRAVMGGIAERYADYVIVTSDNSRSEDPHAIIREILSGMTDDKPHCVIVDRREAIEYAIVNAQKGDIILLAGKGHEEYEITREGKKPFSEKKFVREAFEKRRQCKKHTDNTETEL